MSSELSFASASIARRFLGRSSMQRPTIGPLRASRASRHDHCAADATGADPPVERLSLHPGHGTGRSSLSRDFPLTR